MDIRDHLIYEGTRFFDCDIMSFTYCVRDNLPAKQSDLYEFAPATLNSLKIALFSAMPGINEFIIIEADPFKSFGKVAIVLKDNLSIDEANKATEAIYNTSPAIVMVRGFFVDPSVFKRYLTDQKLIEWV